MTRARLDHGAQSDLTFVPAYRQAMYTEMIDGTWARLALTGGQDPDVMAHVDPERNAAVQKATGAAAKPLMDACSACAMSWCVAALPTPGWAAKIFDCENEGGWGQPVDAPYRLYDRIK